MAKSRIFDEIFDEIRILWRTKMTFWRENPLEPNNIWSDNQHKYCNLICVCSFGNNEPEIIIRQITSWFVLVWQIQHSKLTYYMNHSLHTSSVSGVSVDDVRSRWSTSTSAGGECPTTDGRKTVGRMPFASASNLSSDLYVAGADVSSCSLSAADGGEVTTHSIIITSC